MTIKAFLIRLLLLLVTVLPFTPARAQETEAELSAKALSLFEQQKFVDATPYYLRLLALNPLSHDYNFRYGTCLLFNSYKKQDAFKYLNYSVQDAGTDVTAYYYLGKAYHLNYQFNEAIKNYELYRQKAGPKPKAGLDVDRQIEMCQNGKRLLTTITDIIVLEKKEIDAEKFFRIYDLRNIGGDLLVAAEYQSKIDKKKGHVPLIHFPSDPKAIYYSSYGDTDSGQKDIYVKKKLPDGSWSLPQPVHGNVNTKYDEDYPYMHPNGEYLYFCSRGHNSMGGYDVFRSRIDPETGSFGPPENMDFAISSPDDDLFYVVDSLDATACFASARQSSNGKLYVYKVRVERVPLQLAVIKGNFSSTIKPANKKVSISVTDYASGEKIGVFNSNDKGNYLITFPKGGKYTYEIKVEGKEQVHKYLVSIPFSKEFRPLKQKMIEEVNEETEVVRVLDLFNEDVDDIAGVLAEVIKMRSELNPNAGQFDLEQLDEQKNNAKILADLGFENASPQQIASHFDAIREGQEARVQVQANLVNGGNSSATDKAQQAQKLQEQAKDLVNKANGAAGEQQKFDLLEEAQQKLSEAKSLKQEARTLIAFADSVSAGITIQRENLDKITAIDTEIRKAVADNNMSDLKEVLTGNTTFIADLSKSGSGDATEGLTAERAKLTAEKKSLEQQKSGYQSTADKLMTELTVLNKSLAEAKSKDKPAIQSSIDSKTAERDLVQQEIARLDKKIAQAATKDEEIRKKIEFLNSVTGVQPDKTVSSQDAKSALAAADDPNSRTLEAYVDKQVEAMKKNNVATTSDPGDMQVSPSAILPDYENKLAAVKGATPEERLQAENNIDEQLLDKVNEQLTATEATLTANPNDQSAKDKKQALTTLKSATEKQISNRDDQIAKAQTSVATTEKPSAASELKRLSPDYETALAAASGTTPVEKLQAENNVDQQLLSKVNDELASTETQLAANPNDQSAKDKKQALTTLKSATEKQISNRDDQIAKAQISVATTEKPTAESELKRLSPDYETALASASGTTPIEKLQAQNHVDEQLLLKIENELAATETQLISKPDDQSLSDKKNALTALKIGTERQIADRYDQIDQQSITATEKPSAASELKRLSPDYETVLASASGTTPVEKLQAENKVDQQLLDQVNEELASTETQLAANPNDQSAKDKKQALTTLKSATEKQISIRDDQIAKAQISVATIEKPSAASELKRLSPDYETAISLTSGTTPVEKLQAENKVDQQLLDKVSDELASAETQLAANPNDQQAKDKKEALTALKSATEKQVAARNDRISEVNSAAAFETTPSEELEKIFPEYENQRANLAFTSRKEQLQAENSLDEQLVRLAKEEQAELEGQLMRNPQNTEAKARFDALTSLIAEKQQAIDSRNNELTQIDVAVVESSPVENRIKQLRPDHSANIEKITASTSAGFERDQKLLTEDEALLKEIDSAIEKTRTQLEEQPENESLKTDLALLEELKSIQEAQVSERKLDMLAASRQTADTAQIVAKADPQYQSKAAVGSVDDKIKTEKQHQEKLQGAIHSNEKQLQKSFNPQLAVQNEILADELAQSGTRLEELQSPVAVNATSDAKLRADLGANYDRLMIASPKDKIQAENTLSDLKEYGAQLQDRLGEMDAANPERPLVEEQLQAVRKRIGIVEADLDALSHTAGTTDATSAIEKRVALEEQLNAPGLSASEKKKIQGELTALNKEIDQSTETKEQQQLASTSAEVQKAEDQLRVPENRTELSESVLSHPKTTTTTTTQEQLQQAEERKSLLAAVSSFNEAAKAFKEDSIVIESRESLLARKRRFSIEIGELEREITAAEKDPKNSANVSGLQREKAALELAVAELDQMLLAVTDKQERSKEATVSNDVTVPYERELALAADPSYVKIRAQSQNVEDIRKELAYTEKEMDAVRNEIAKEPNPSKREGFIAVLKALDEQEQEYSDMLAKEKARLEETISISGLPKAEIYNLLARGVEPNIQRETAVVPENLKDGFNILENQAQATSARDLKMEDALPRGLVYRVQVGAFAKPVPEDRFKEFTPVTGEKLPSGITRYMAGYFSQRQAALRAMNEIRGLGYADAFPVAYCDGERISLAEAKRLEEAGLCKAVSQDSLVMEIVQAQNEKAGIPAVVAPKPGDYNKAMGAVAAEAVEERHGLFFTVQVGVYNKPATAVQLREISPLITKRLPNGQLRYSSGIFPSAEAARPKRQEAVLRGIADAFIVAYYKGERITLQEANALLAEQGTGILETAAPEYQLVTLDSAQTFAAENPETAPPSQSQLVSSRTYPEYPGEELSKLNVNGNYYYDAEDHRIKSVPTLTAKTILTDTSLQIVEVDRNFELKSAAIVSRWAGSSMNGALADWLLHATAPYSYTNSENGFELRFDDVSEDSQNELTAALQKLGAISVITERD